MLWRHHLLPKNVNLRLSTNTLIKHHDLILPVHHLRIKNEHTLAMSDSKIVKVW